MPSLTIQCRSPTICHPRHSAERGDKDRCDKKQPRQQACAPFLSETLTPRAWQNHSNVLARHAIKPLPLTAACGRKILFSRRARGCETKRFEEPVAAHYCRGNSGLACHHLFCFSEAWAFEMRRHL